MFHHLVCQTLDFSDKNICLYKIRESKIREFQSVSFDNFLRIIRTPTVKWELKRKATSHIVYSSNRDLLNSTPAAFCSCNSFHIKTAVDIYHHWGFHSFCQQLRTLRLLYILMGGNILSILVHLHFSATSNLFSISQCDWNNTAIINFKVHRFSW